MRFKWNIQFIFKLTISVVAYVYMVYVVINAPDLKNILNTINGFGFSDIIMFLLVLLLMLMNWSVESIKWIYLLKNCYKLSFGCSLQSVFAGTTVGMATPNRMGEFAGRILFVPPALRADAGMLSISGSFSQLFVTLTFGLIGFIGLLIYVPTSHGAFAVNDYIIIAVSGGFMILMLWLYSNTKLIARVLMKIGFIKNKINFSNVNLSLSAGKKWVVMLLSAFRYAIFLHQFYLMILIFGISISYLETLQVVSCLYLLMAIIPVVSAGEPGVRGTISILLFSFFSDQPTAALSASISLWFINLAIPAILGSFLLMNKKKHENS